MFTPRVALASLSGRSDAAWAGAVEEHVGAAFLGGIALDDATREAARAMVERDREEFLPPEPVAFVDRELAKLADAPLRPAFNVRSVAVGPVREAAQVCHKHGAVLEVNAHCRQAEMCAAGAGETLLRDTDRLCEQVAAAADEGAVVSVKVRTELDGVALPETARQVVAAGADAVHVDAMDSEPVVAQVVRAVRAVRAAEDAEDAEDAGRGFVIANNGVRHRATTREYLAYGADAVSVGRASDDPRVLEQVSEATEAWFARARGQREGVRP